jgi:hypothetical protein|tara:strand:+ start:472 stop:708 length:237 start_codon:yes stop_codon:yes gene_type:complete
MQFRQSTEDGSCDIYFSEQELEVIKKHGKVHFSAEVLRHFGNTLMKIVADFNLHFSDELKKTESKEDMIVEGDDKFNK